MKDLDPRQDHPARTWWSSILISIIGVFVLCTAAFAVTALWTRTVNGSADSADAGEYVALAPNGDIYVVGRKMDTGEELNIWIRKYSPAGVTRWTRVIDGPMTGGVDFANGAAVDSAGNLYVVGAIQTTGGAGDIWIRKYSSEGAKLWTRTYNGPASTWDSANGVAVDSADNIYVVGTISVPSEESNIWVRKYGSDGVKKWTRTVNGPADGSDLGVGVAVDSAKNVYVTGSIWNAGGEDLWIRKYNRSGGKIWTRTIDGSAGSNDRGLHVAVDSVDNPIVSGYISVTNEADNMWIRKYTPSGGKLWTRTLTGSGARNDHARGVAVDSNDAVYVIGFRSRTDSEIVALLRKYSSTGVTRWTTTYAGPEDEAYGNRVAVTSDKRIYVTGEVRKAGRDKDIWVSRYEQ